LRYIQEINSRDTLESLYRPRQREAQVRLAGKVAIITGGGRGIGRAIALAFSREGAEVAVAARTRAEIGEVVEQISASGGQAIAVQADVSSEEDVARMVSQTVERFQQLDILVNNAGMNFPYRAVLDLSLAEWNRVLEVNLTGPFLCSRAVLPKMIEQRSGKIINISSIGGRRGAAGRSPYRPTKAALINFTECLAAEVKEFGIDVNAICAGRVATDMLRNILHGTPSPGAMKPEEIAAVAVFLASDEASGVTGTAIDAFGTANPLFGAPPPHPRSPQ